MRYFEDSRESDEMEMDIRDCGGIPSHVEGIRRNWQTKWRDKHKNEVCVVSEADNQIPDSTSKGGAQ